MALGITKGSFTPARLAAAATAAEKGNVEFFLSEGLTFFGGDTMTSIRTTDVQRLLEAPIHLPDWMSEGLELRRDEKMVQVRTCN
jgi:hypothetical protein